MRFTPDDRRLFILAMSIGVLAVVNIVCLDSFRRRVSEVEEVSQTVSKDFNVFSLDTLRDTQTNSQRITLLEQSVDSKTKRWAYIKLVRDVIRADGNQNLTVEESISIASAIVDRADEFNVPVSLIMAIIECESNFDKTAISSAGAEGLMQLLPSTAENTAAYLDIKYYNLQSPKYNIHLGVAHLAKLLHLYKEDIPITIRAYNCGTQCIANVQSGKWPDYPDETKGYVEKVIVWKKVFDLKGISW